jgi:hypothetical protein
MTSPCAKALLSLFLLLAQTNEAFAMVALRGNGKQQSGNLAPDAPSNFTAKGSSGIVNLAAGSTMRAGFSGLLSKLGAEAKADAAKVSAKSGQNPDAIPSMNKYTKQCSKYMKNFIATLDQHYTDAQLQVVLENECLLQSEFPKTKESFFNNINTSPASMTCPKQVCKMIGTGIAMTRHTHLDAEAAAAKGEEWVDPLIGRPGVVIKEDHLCQMIYFFFYPRLHTGADSCPCVGFDDVDGTTQVALSEDVKANYPADLGASCQAWDANSHPDCEGWQWRKDVPNWCTRRWCYVDPCNCNTLDGWVSVPPKLSSYMPSSTYKGRPVYYSYATCMDTDEWIADEEDACENQGSEEKCSGNDKCAWSKNSLGVSSCLGKELVETCKKPLPEETLQTSGSTACMCVGMTNRNGSFSMAIDGGKVAYSGDTGSSCKAWDHGLHPECQGNHMQAWCLQAWCFVDPCSCDLPTPPKMSGYLPDSEFQGKHLFWSYATCGGTDMYSGTNYLDACVNQMSDKACAKNDKCAWTGDRCLGRELVNQCPVDRVKAEIASIASVKAKAAALAAAPSPAPGPAPGPSGPSPGPGPMAVTTVAKKEISDNYVVTSADPFSQIGSLKCPCIGFAGLEGTTLVTLGDDKVSFPADLGGTCMAWDDKTHTDCKEGSDSPWCQDKWCYVDPCNCDIEVLPKKSTYLPGSTFQGKTVYYSYATCGNQDQWTAENNEGACVNADSAEDCSDKTDCLWKDGRCGGKEIMGECAVKTPEQIGKPKCKCVGIFNQAGSTFMQIGQDKVKYPADAGAMCSSWDKEAHPDCLSDSPPDWCEKSWCYVDPCECELEVPPKTSSYMENTTFQGKPLYYSYATCDAVDTFTKEEATEACVNQDSADKCNALTKCAWAPTNECLGKELVGKCPSHQLKIQEFDVGAPGCQCVGIAGVKGETDVEHEGSFLKYPADLGGHCQAWDAKVHPDCEGDSPAEWCGKKWCYVDPCTCNQPKSPILGTYMKGANFQGKPLYYSYGTCGSPPAIEAKPSCVLEATKDGCEAVHKEVYCSWTGKSCVLKELAEVCDKEDDSSEAKALGNKDCKCIGLNNVSGYTALMIEGTSVDYAGDMGSGCKAWDQGKHPDCAGDSSPPWCKQQWCYVDPCSCHIPTQPKESMYIAGASYQNHPLYYSYATCTEEDNWSHLNNKASCTMSTDEDKCNARTSCGWDGSQCVVKALLGKCAAKVEMKAPEGPKDPGDDDCSCIGWTGIEGKSPVMYGRGLAEYPGDMGSHCKAWDENVHPDCKSEDAPKWCKQAWCYVNPCKCKLGDIPKITVTNLTYSGMKAFYSYATCKQEDLFTSGNNPDACINQFNYHACVSKDHCGWDGAKCDGKAQLDQCNATGAEEVVGLKQCKCIGMAGLNGTKTVQLASSVEEYPADVGAYCKAWDDEEHPDCSADIEDADKPSWCLKKWCMVDPCSCDLPVPPKTTQYFEGAKWGKRSGYYSYATCGETDEYTADNFAEECTNQATADLCGKSDKCLWNAKKSACMGKEIGLAECFSHAIDMGPV